MLACPAIQSLTVTRSSWTTVDTFLWWRALPLLPRFGNPSRRNFRTVSQVRTSQTESHVTTEKNMQPNKAEVPSSPTQVLSLLHKTMAFLPRSLPDMNPRDRLSSAAFWCRLLENATAELSPHPVSALPKARIAGETSCR